MPNSATFGQDLGQLLQATGTIYEHIKLADQKALVFVTLDGALIGGIYGIGILSSSTGVMLVVACITLLGLLFGMGSALVTIWPRRTRHGETHGLIDPARIAMFENAEAYSDFAGGISAEEFQKEVFTRIFDLSMIDRDKYNWLRRSIIISAGAWLCALFAAAHHAFTTCP